MPRITEDQTDSYFSGSRSEWFTLKNHKEVARVQFMINTVDDVEIFACHKVKIGDKERYVDCNRQPGDPIDACAFCAAGIEVKPVRFIVMFDHRDNKVKIWERGREFMKLLEGLSARYAPLIDRVFEIERNGEAGNKKTTYNVFPFDTIAGYDLSGMERPDIEGGLVLQKSNDDMNVYLNTERFPATDDDPAPAAPPPVRRTQANTPPPAPTAPVASPPPARTAPPAQGANPPISRRAMRPDTPAATTPSGTGREGEAF